MRIITELDNSSHLDVTSYLSMLLPNHELNILPESNSQDQTKKISTYFWDQTHCDAIEASLSQSAARLLHVRAKCGMETINQDFPPLATEKVIGHGYTYLKTSYANLIPGTPAIWRKTDQATTYFIFDDTFWANEIVNINVPGATDKNEIDKIGISLLSSLGMAVVEGFMGSVGSSIFDKIFGSKTNHFDELYKKISGVIKDELSKNEIDLVDGKLNGVIVFVRNEYNPMRNSGLYKKEVLFSTLKPHHNNLYEHIGILSHNRYERLGLSGYMACIYEYILLTQELANIDPNVPSVDKSAYLQTIQATANDAINHVTRVANDVCNSRRNFISVKTFKKGHACGHDVVVTTHYQWHDSYTNTWSQEFSYNSSNKKYNPENDCRDRANERKAAMYNELYSELMVQNFLNAMNKLKNKPMP
ncbi:hypothetical protein TUM12370_20600 [Salmonella enterica subsp. enterica serovar Choleraesuis]|nr:hypothetical protein TUM12370_20600 [Salmonella enterica subsp. enterica serovar Choleraesuis]